MQAHVFAAVMDNQQVDSPSPSAQQQRDVLAAALTSAVWQVQQVLPPAMKHLTLDWMYLDRRCSPIRKHIHDDEHAVLDVSLTMLTTLLNASRCAQYQMHMPSQAWLQLFNCLSC